jgi:hypothetical protein
MLFNCLQMASLPSQRTNKLCTRAHHSDHSIAAAIFANGTYFVDMPRTSALRHQTKCSISACLLGNMMNLEECVVYWILSLESTLIHFWTADFSTDGISAGLLLSLVGSWDRNHLLEGSVFLMSLVTVCLCTCCHVKMFTIAIQATMYSLLHVLAETWLPSCCLVMDVFFSDITIPAFRCHVTILIS